MTYVPSGYAQPLPTTATAPRPAYEAGVAAPAGGGAAKQGLPEFVRQFLPAGMVDPSSQGAVLFNPDTWFLGEPRQPAPVTAPPKGYAPQYQPGYGPEAQYQPGYESGVYGPPGYRPPPGYGPPSGEAGRGATEPRAEPKPPPPGVDQSFRYRYIAQCGAQMCCGPTQACCLPPAPPAPLPSKGKRPVPAPRPKVDDTPGQGSPKQVEPTRPVDGDSKSPRTYVVKPGDNLSKIAAEYDVTWRQLYWFNRDKIDHPDLIFPGQKLKIPPGDLKVPDFDYTPRSQPKPPRPSTPPKADVPPPSPKGDSPSKGDPSPKVDPPPPPSPPEADPPPKGNPPPAPPPPSLPPGKGKGGDATQQGGDPPPPPPSTAQDEVTPPPPPPPPRATIDELSPDLPG